MIHMTTGRDLKDVMLSEKSLSKVTYVMIRLNKSLKMTKLHREHSSG